MNLAILVGTIVSDVVRTELPKGSVTKFRVKTVEQFTMEGEVKESSQTHLIDVWNTYLQNGIVKTLAKGQMVEVHGSINSRNIARDGEPARWTTTIVIRGLGSINVLGGAKSGMSVAAEAQPEPAEPRVDHSPRKPTPVGPAADGLDDDIPF
jgi:single-stranded DNA-binding protein